MISDESLAALLAGAEPPPGSAPQLRPLAAALAELTARPVNDELEGEAETLAAFRNQFRAASPAHRSHRRRRRPLSRPLSVRTAAAGAAVLSVGAFTTAAYAGALPGPVQRLAHEMIAAPSPRIHPSSGRSPAAQPVTGHSGYGLCIAWAHATADGTPAQRAAAFGKLAVAAGGAAKVAAYCAAETHPGTSASHRPHPDPTPHGSGKPSGHPSPHGSGKPSGHPSPRGSGKPSAHPTPEPTVHPTGKPGTSGGDGLSAE